MRTAFLFAAASAATARALQVSITAKECSATVSWEQEDHELGVVIAPHTEPFVCTEKLCSTTVPLRANSSVYAVDRATRRASRVAVSWPDMPASCADVQVDDAAVGSAGTAPRVGVLYEAWHGFAAYAQSLVSQKGGQPLCVEDVLMSNGSLGFTDIYAKYGITNNDNFVYQSQSEEHGYYCIYRKRANETTGIIPDCTNIEAVLTTHAKDLTSAGIDFVTLDGTNLGNMDPEADVIQVRPYEVVFEVWSQLRKQGVATPQVVAWQRLNAGGTLWQNCLDAYNNASYADLVLKDPATGKMVFFTPLDADPTVQGLVESNGGRNNIVVQTMWALFDPAEYVTQGLWGFMTPCTAEDNKGNLQYTTSVVGRDRGATGCGQFVTQNSTLGSCISVSPSYQLSYGSVPFSAAGKFDGLTFKRTFGTIFDNAASKWRSALEGKESDADELVSTNAFAGIPDNIYLSSYNEYISQPQPNPFNSPYSYSMGLEQSAGHGNSSSKNLPSLFVDTFGTSIGRDIEATVQKGDQLYQIMASCLRVVNLMSALDGALLAPADRAGSFRPADAKLAADEQSARESNLQLLLSIFGYSPEHSSMLSSCQVAGEVCCAYNATAESYNLAWSLKMTSAPFDHLLTTDANELGNLTCTGCAWKQVCNAYGGGTDWCTDGSIVGTHDVLEGPFVLHSAGCGAGSGDPQLPGRVPVYRCITGGSLHYIDSDASCNRGGIVGHAESLIGCADTSLSSNMPRSLRLCASGSSGSSGPFYHSLDGACVQGDTDLGIIGYVH